MNSPIHAQQKKTQEIKLINTNNLLMDYEFFDHLQIVQKLLLKGSKFTQIKDCENILNQLLEQITVIEIFQFFQQLLNDQQNRMPQNYHIENQLYQGRIWIPQSVYQNLRNYLIYKINIFFMDQEQARFIAQSIFSYYDKDKNGQLNDQELIQMMMNNYQFMGQRFSPSKQDIDQYADVLDATKNRSITLADFESLCIKYFTQNQINIVFQRQIKKKQYTQYAQDRLDKAKQLFKRFDKDGSLEIDENEAYQLLEETFKQCGMQKTPTKDDLIQWMALTDTNGDGKISLEEFQDLVIKSLISAGIDIYQK